MKNNHQQILSEIKSLMASVKAQVEELENKLAEYQQLVEIQDIENDLPVEESIEEKVEEPLDGETVEPVETESVEVVTYDVMDIELEPSDDLPFYDDLPVSEPEPSAELGVEPDVDVIEECVSEVEDLPEEVNDTVVEEVTEAVEEQEVKPVVKSEAEQVATPLPMIDAMIAKQPWRSDMPGSPVRDIRSAISLNDRILFINYLFGEDPMAFQEMLTQLNAMTSFDEAAAHAISAHPEWNLESDTVYRFMMALRRRHQ